MLQFTGAGKRFGPKVLFEGFDCQITTRDRIGLVGKNGTGKSTLLKVIGGMESLDYGSLETARGVTKGYLPQDGLQLSGRTVFQECLSVFANLHDMERELETLTHRMADLDPAGEEYAIVSDRFHRLQTEFVGRDGYALEYQVGTVLNGLSFGKEDWARHTEEFSGGWQMRIALAKLLLEKPNLLLLDEPTNHLDLEARNWLEAYLQNYPYAYVLISHDRFFLDTTVSRIAELWNKRVYLYAGNYSKFLRQKDERLTQLQAAQRNQQERIDQLEAFISRFRYQATKAKQVQSRIKELEKIERIDIPPEEATIHFRFPQPKPSGRVVAEFHNVSKSYGVKHVLGGINFLIERGDRIALVGVNGAGKSTLIKLLSGAEPLSAGDYRLGHNVEVDYFAQDQYKELNPASRLLDDLQEAAPRRTNTELRSLLGCFLFTEDDVFKQIGVLSGGERNRYALAKMLLSPSNFLLLDEPTNHLDMQAKDVLLNALKEFEGTVVFVSHDRYFIDQLATRVFEIEGGEVRDFPGNYEDYLWKKEGRTDAAAPEGPVATATGIPLSLADVPIPEEAAVNRQKRLNPIKVQKLRDRASSIETRIAAAEAEIAALEKDLSDYKSVDETIRVTQLLKTRRAEVESLMAEWEEVSMELEASSSPA